MCRGLPVLLVLIILVASTVVGCGEGSSIPSAIATILEIEGHVSMMKAGTDS